MTPSLRPWIWRQPRPTCPPPRQGPRVLELDVRGKKCIAYLNIVAVCGCSRLMCCVVACESLVYSLSMFTPKASENQAMRGLWVSVKFRRHPRFLFPVVSCYPLTQHSDLGRRSLQNYKPNASEQSNAAADLPLADTFLWPMVTQNSTLHYHFQSFSYIFSSCSAFNIVQRAFSCHSLCFEGVLFSSGWLLIPAVSTWQHLSPDPRQQALEALRQQGKLNTRLKALLCRCGFWTDLEIYAV